MNVSSIQPETPTAPEQTQRPGQPTREEFLSLLVTQMQHQDPLQPMEGTEFVTQLAQFSSVEQLLQINERLGLIEVGQASAVNSQAAGLAGQTVTIRADAIRVTEAHISEEVVPIRFDLEGAARSGTVTITDHLGRSVGTVDFGPRGSGTQQVNWKLPEGLPAGKYDIRIEALNESGEPVPAHGRLFGVVTEVSFENGYPELLIDDIRVRLADIISVGAPQPEGS